MPFQPHSMLLTFSVLWCYFSSRGVSVIITQQGDAVAGRPLILQCKINRVNGNTDPIQWNRLRGTVISVIYSSTSCISTISINPTIPGFSGGCEEVSGAEVYRLTIQNVTLDMERFTWRCSRGRLDTIIAEKRLNVKVMVTAVTLRNPPDRILAGNPLNLTCVTEPSKPQACIRWYTQRATETTKEITMGQPICNQDLDVLKPTVRSLEFVPRSGNNRASLYCTAVNDVTLTAVRSQQYTLEVQYPPTSPLSISGYDSNSPVESGLLSLTCDVGEGNPEPTLTWSSVCAGRVPGNNGRQSVTLNVDRSLNGESCSCQGNQAGSLTGWTEEGRFTFNVTFGPDSVSLTSDSGQSGDRVHVTENTTVRLTCTGGESSPPAILTWYRNNSIGQTALLDTTRGDNNGYIVSGRYTLIPDRYMDGRTVRCEARRPGQLTNKTTSIILDVKYKPVIFCRENKITVFDGQPVDVSCVVESNPSANVRVLINSKQVNPLFISLANSSRTNHTQSLNLKLPATELSSSGVIEIKATNNIGATNLDISVTIRAGQFLTEYIEIRKCENNEVTLAWASGIEASLVDYFKLEYRRRGIDWDGKIVKNPGQLRLIETTVSDLESEVNYEFRIQPNFNIALSQYATTNCTLKDTEKNESTALSAVSIGVGIVLGVVLVILVGGLVVIILFRRGNLIWNKGFRKSNQSYGQELPSMTVSGNTQIGTYEDIDMNRAEGKPYETISTTTGGVYENSAAI